MPIKDEKKLLKILGKRLEKARKAANLSRADVFIKTGVGQQTIVTWEKGTKQPGALMLGAVCQVLGVGLDDIVPTQPTKRAQRRV